MQAHCPDFVSIQPAVRALQLSLTRVAHQTGSCLVRQHTRDAMLESAEHQPKQLPMHASRTCLPGSPTKTGLFLVRRHRMRMTLRISSSRPITGSRRGA